MQSGLDKHFNEKLRGYESTVDAEAIWEAVRPPRKRRPIWWLWLLLLAGLAGGATWWWNMTPVELAEKQVEQDIVSTGRVAVDTDVVNAEAESSTTNIDVENSLTIEQSGRDIQQKEEVINTHLSPIEQQQAITQTTTNVPVASVAYPVVSAAIDLDAEQNAADQLPLSNQDPNLESIADVVIATSEREVPNRETKVVGEVPGIIYQVNRDRALPSYEIDCATFGPQSKRASGWFGQVSSAYFMLDRTLSIGDSLDREEGTRWLSLRERYETPLEAWSAELSVGYQHQRGWQLRSGLAMTQINTEFAIEQLVDSIGQVNGVQTIIITPEGDSTFITGPVEEVSTIRYQKRTYNSLRSWEVPVLIGYRFGRKNWALNVETGPRLLLQQSWEGEVYTSDGERILDLAEQDWYSTKLQLHQWQLGATISYQFQSGLQLGIGIDSRIPLQAISAEQAPFKEKFRLYGLQLTARYMLSGSR